MRNRTHVFLFDGTWNGRDDIHPTNIRRLHECTWPDDHLPFYFPGPGNEDENSKVMQWLGGAFGAGSWEIRDMAINALASVYRPGDKIAALGFSRGAANARMFCAEIGKNGFAGHKPEIEFLGCFDTVAAYFPVGPFQQGVFHDLNVSPAVKRAAHAVAIDEDRETFEPNLMNRREGVTEVWFPGVHCDVGGGLAETGLSDTALLWMIGEMAEAGIKAKIDLSPNPAAPIGVNNGLFRREPRRVGVKVDGEWSELEAVRF